MTHSTPAALWLLAACESLGPTCCANTLGRRFPQAAHCCQLFQLHVVYLFLRWHSEHDAALSSFHIPNPHHCIERG